MRVKLILTILLFCVFTLNVNAQLTITSAYNPVIGDVEKYFTCDTAGVMPGDSGLNRTWNFSNVVTSDSTINNYINPIGTPFDSLFPLANVVSYENPTYRYYKTSPNQYEYMGYAYQDFREVFSNTEIMMFYPFTYNSSYIDTVSGSGMLSGFSFNVAGSISKRGDATGTINLPFGTFSNVLRIKTVTIEIDSVPLFNLVYSFSSVGYQWYAGSFKFPVFSIWYDTSIQNGDTTWDRQVFYCYSQPIGIKEIRNSFPASFKLYQNFPNPFNPTTKIKFSLPLPTNGREQLVKLSIYDVLGREVAILLKERLQSGTYEVEWDASNYPSGVYFYRLTAGDYSETKKMVLLK